MRCVIGVLIPFLIIWGGSIGAAQKVLVKMKNHYGGANAVYKHSFTTRFKSDRADLLSSRISMVGGREDNFRNEDVRFEVTGEWRTREYWTPLDDASEGSGEWKSSPKSWRRTVGRPSMA